MATLPELEDALRNADAAGDVDAARQLADEIVRMRGAGQSAAPAPATPQVNQGFDAPNYVLQQGLKGLANAVGAPVDLAAAGINVGLSGADMLAELFGGNVDTRVSNPVFGSQWVKDRGADVGSALGVEPVANDAVSGGVRKAGYLAEGAAGAMVPGFGMAAAPAQAARSIGSPIMNAFRNLGAPYATNPGATLARDAVAGAGAGLASGMYEQNAPQALQESIAGPFLQAGASLMGGAGGALASSLAEGAAGAAANATRNMVRGRADPNAPVNPATGQPYTRAEMDSAARVAQQMPSNRAETLSNLEQNTADFRQFARPDEVPTTGMLADDVGMAMQENILRTRDAQRFAERDAARRSAASAAVERSAPAGADPRAFTGAAERQYDDIRAGAQQTLDDATNRQQQAQRDIAAQRADIEEYRARQPQASTALDAEFRGARDNARGMKNDAYDSVGLDAPVPGQPVQQALDAIDAQMSDVARDAPGAYAAIAGRLRSRFEVRDPETNEVVGFRDMTWNDLKDLRAQISSARKASVGASGESVAGSGADVARLDALNRVLGKLADDVNPEAARFYREEYAPRFKEGRAGEYGAAIDRSARTGGESSATRPTEFGDKFLRRPEDAASLRRALTPETTPKQDRLPGPGGQRTSGMFPESEQNVRDWMMGDLAKSGVLTDNAEIRYDRFRAWADKNRKTIDQFPEVQRMVDAELDRARKGGMISKQMADEVARAKENLNLTERDLRRSALQAAIGNSPENAVDALMRSGDPQKKVAEMVSRLKGDSQAIEGLKAAVRDWIKSEAGVTSKIVGDSAATRLSRAKLENLFNKHEKALAEIYTPDEMNALRQAHKLMGAEANLDVRTTAGSNTVDKAFAQQNADVQQRQRLLEAALKAKFGVLKGGGVFRTITLFMQSLPNGRQAIDDVLFEMQFNPDLAKHLLTRPVKEIDTQPWNAKLNALLAAAAGAREAVDDNSGDTPGPMTLTVTRKDKEN